MNRKPQNSHIPASSPGNPFGENFLLTGAVQPAPTVRMPLRQGYRLDSFRDPNSRTRLGMLAAAASADRLFDLFLELLEPLGDDVHAILESSHGLTDDEHRDLRRSHIDPCVLSSTFCDYEDLLLEDGCTGVAIVSARKRIEVQFDEHKLLFIYARDLSPFRKILRRFDVLRLDSLHLIAEADHTHTSSEAREDEFHRMASRMGATDVDAVLSDEAGW